MKTVARLRSLLLAMGMGLAVQASADAPVIAVYRGDAGCPGCSEAVEQAIHRSRPDYHVVFVGPGEAVDVDSLATSRYRAYVQPGGGQDIDAAMAAVGEEGAAVIRRFVDAGGTYIGLCMGAYLAGASHLGLLAQDLDAEAGRPGFPVQDEDDAVIPVVWDGRRQTVYFQDGPYLPKAPRDQGFKVISRYTNGDIAAASYRYGKGRVVLSGPHPEAPTQWFKMADIPLSQMPSADLFKSLLDEDRR
ncbi:BPL-N domain-containing protein [Stenotrophomonas pavanii]|uniref:BPL-N domain-containing protein n=1 Tax=Stenotrophomonas pavanii TaxID=487698 RepID=UPI002DBB3992|nr:BPL-N domain-containing protein [Stenotrophomonas pavanii]MEC4338285.1 BPL-N domain-containing protein [Stenotrophomonas pavanii]